MNGGSNAQYINIFGPYTMVWNATIIANTRPGEILALEVLSDELYAFCTDHIEIWKTATGASPFQFWFFIDRGLIAADSLVKANNTLYWLDDTRRFVTLAGRSPQIISTSYDRVIQGYDTVSDCVGNLIEIDGHPFLMWSFPTQEKTLIADFGPHASNKEAIIWYERGRWDNDISDFLEYGYRNHAWCPEWNLHIFSSNTSPKLYSATDNYLDEDGSMMRTLIRTGNLDFGTFFDKVMNRLLIRCKRGYGDITADNSPYLMLRWSDDGGTNWTEFYYIDLQRQGSTGLIADLWGLGMFQTRCFEITLTDSVPLVITNITADVKAGSR